MGLASFIPSFEIIESPQNPLNFVSLDTGQPEHVLKTSPAEDSGSTSSALG